MESESSSADLDAWLAEARADEAIQRRVRQRWIEQQSAEGATLAGALLDLAEASTPVLITTIAARHRGYLRGVAPDFFALRTDQQVDGLIPLSSLSSVQPAIAGAREPMTAREPVLDVLLADALQVAAGDRPRVRVAAADRSIAGRLWAAGVDVVTIRTDHAEQPVVYVPVSAIGEVWFTG